jgi:hypothetical protein
MSETYRQLSLKTDLLNKDQDSSCKSLINDLSARNHYQRKPLNEDSESDFSKHLVKSPIELKEKLSSIYSEYVNVKQRHMSSSQYFNKHSVDKKSDTIQQSEQASARRRSSNNYNVTSNTQI